MPTSTTRHHIVTDAHAIASDFGFRVGRLHLRFFRNGGLPGGGVRQQPRKPNDVRARAPGVGGRRAVGAGAARL